MNYDILSTHRFDKELKRLAKKYPSLKRDFAGLLALLSVNPQTGTPLGKQCFKIRLAISDKGRGKSGGARVITCVHVQAAVVYLLTVYDKAEMSDIRDGDLREMIANL